MSVVYQVSASDLIRECERKSEWYRVSFNSRLWKEMRVFLLIHPA